MAHGSRYVQLTQADPGTASSARRPGRSSRRTIPGQTLRASEDDTQLHAPAALAGPAPVACLAPPPKTIARTTAEILQDLDRMSGELHVERLEAGAARTLDQAAGLVAPQVAEPPVVAAVRGAEDR